MYEAEDIRKAQQERRENILKSFDTSSLDKAETEANAEDDLENDGDEEAEE